MKMTNEYFHKYNTRKVKYKQSSGLFYVDGISVDRDDIEDQKNTISNIPPHSSRMSTPLKSPSTTVRLLGKTYQRSINSPSKSMSYTSEHNSTTFIHSVDDKHLLSRPLYEIIAEKKVLPPPNYYSRLTTNTPSDFQNCYEIVEDHHKAIREAKVEFHKHIYHDDNHLRNHQETKLVNTTHRLWFPSIKNIKSLENTWKTEIHASSSILPANHKELGLSPLRMKGPSMQDKPHHISVNKNNFRLKTKIPSRNYTGPN